MEDLGTLGGANSSGVDINEAGQITGTSDAPSDFYPNGTTRAFFWGPDTRAMQTVEPISDSEQERWDGFGYSYAVAINNAGRVAGYWDTSHVFYVQSAFVWNPQTGQRQPFSIVAYTRALDINDSGQVMLFGTDHGGGPAGYRWNTADNTIDAVGEGPVAMNEAGQVAGWTEFQVPPTPDDPAPYVRHSFFWDTTHGIVDLGTLGSPGGSATFDPSEAGMAINNAGEVTGTSMTADGVQHAFLWDRRLKMRDLNALIATDDPLIGFVTLEGGVAINDAGRILVSGVDNRTGEQRSYLLTPRTVPFAQLRSRTNIDLRPVHGKDWFDTFAPFTLGADSNGIAPLKEPVTIQIGTFSATIPARSFKTDKWRFHLRRAHQRREAVCANPFD